MKLFCKVRVIYGEPMPAAQFAMERPPRYEEAAGQ